ASSAGGGRRRAGATPSAPCGEPIWPGGVMGSRSRRGERERLSRPEPQQLQPSRAAHSRERPGLVEALERGRSRGHRELGRSGGPPRRSLRAAERLSDVVAPVALVLVLVAEEARFAES